MSKARDLASYMSTNGLLADGVITGSEITDLTEISEGDTVLSIEDTGTGGKVLIKVDNGVVGNINSNGIVIPTGSTSERNSNAALGELRYNTDTNKFEGYSSGGWYTIENAPLLTSITPTSFDGTSGSSFTIAGGFLETGSTVKLRGTDGTLYTPATITHTSVTSLSFTTATDLPVSNEPYSVIVTNPGGLSATLTDAIDAGSNPEFQTASGTLFSTTQWNGSGSATVSATDGDEGAISDFSIVGGALPSGFSLNTTTGAITGTGDTAQATTTYTFTIQAEDSAGNTATRAFTIVITNALPSFAGETSSFSFVSGSSNTITLNATDPEGQSITYSLQSGTLPSGMTLSGNTVSGTPSTPGSNSFTIAATDPEGGVGTLAYSVTITQSPELFTNIGQNAYTAGAGQVYEFIIIGGGGYGGNNGGGGGGAGGAYFRGKYTPSSSGTFSIIVGQPGTVNGDGSPLQSAQASSLALSGAITITAGAGGNGSSYGGSGGTVTTVGSGITTVYSRSGGNGGDGTNSWGTGGGGAAGGGDGGSTVSGTSGSGGRYGQDYTGALNGGAPGANGTRSDWHGSSGGGKADLVGAGGGGGGAGTVGNSNGAQGGAGGGSITVSPVTMGGTGGGGGGSNGGSAAGAGGQYGGGGAGGRSSYGPPNSGKKGAVFIWPSS